MSTITVKGKPVAGVWDPETGEYLGVPTAALVELAYMWPEPGYAPGYARAWYDPNMQRWGRYQPPCKSVKRLVLVKDDGREAALFEVVNAVAQEVRRSQ